MMSSLVLTIFKINAFFALLYPAFGSGLSGVSVVDLHVHLPYTFIIICFQSGTA